MDDVKRNFWQKMTIAEKLLAIILAVVFLFIFYIALDANKYSAQVIVIEGKGKVGVNPTTERLDFGDLSPGTSAVRRVDITNRTPVPVYVAVLRFGSINDLMKLNKSFFTLRARSSDKIEFTVYMPASAPIGDKLTGRIFIFKIPGPWR